MRPIRVTVTNAADSQVIPLDRFEAPFAVGIRCNITSGTPTYTVQYTFDDVFADGFTPAGADWVNHASLNAAVADADSNIAFPVTAIRITQTGTGVTTMTVIQGDGF